MRYRNPKNDPRNKVKKSKEDKSNDKKSK